MIRLCIYIYNFLWRIDWWNQIWRNFSHFGLTGCRTLVGLWNFWRLISKNISKDAFLSEYQGSKIIPSKYCIPAEKFMFEHRKKSYDFHCNSPKMLISYIYLSLNLHISEKTYHMSTRQDTSMYVDYDRSNKNMLFALLMVIHAKKRTFYWILQAKMSWNFYNNKQ